MFTWASQPDCWGNKFFHLKDYKIWVFSVDEKRTSFRISADKGVKIDTHMTFPDSDSAIKFVESFLSNNPK